MTESQAETLATVLMGVAAAGAAWFILRIPALRRPAWSLVATTASAAAPWLMAEARAAWDASARSEARVASASRSPEAG
jgi:hypothetical protein